MKRPPESLKSFANHVATRLASKDGLEAARLLQLISGSENPVASGGAAPDLDHIGIWERTQANGQDIFVRSKEKMDDWRHWANIGQIGSKGKKRRVVFMGESVARGYLYDPLYTPAMVLEKILQARLGEDAVEVIDLARTAIAFEIRDVALSAIALEPDAVVMFCGNNWRCSFPVRPVDMPYLSSAIRERGIPGCKEYAESSLRSQAERVIHDVATLYAAKGIPLLWIIPEFNLGDWRDPVANAPHLANGGNREWLAHWRTARTSLSAGNYDAAAEAARQMINIDQGVSAAGFYVLAECSRERGDLDAARHSLEMARDACIWDTSILYSPRSFSLTQKTQRELAVDYTNDVVDSPALFKEYLNGGIPDRRLFIDYCHLTTEGIQVTMAAAASSLMRSLNGPEVPWRELLVNAPAPSKEVESEAHFLAAVHNAHWWQGRDLVQYYSSQAVYHSQHIVPVLKSYLDFQTRRTPLLMCTSAEKVVEFGSPQIQHYLFRYNNQQLDELLLGTIVQALKDVDSEAKQQLDQLRIQEHSVASFETNLLDYYYNSSAHQPHEVGWVTPLLSTIVALERHYYRAFSQESKFIFVAGKDCPVALDLVCRIPYPEHKEEEIAVRFNGEHITKLSGSSEWGRYQIIVPAKMVKEGLNEIAVIWPTPDFPGEEALEKAANDIIHGKSVDFCCPFGEIHAFFAGDGTKVEPTSTLDQPELSSIAN